MDSYKLILIIPVLCLAAARFTPAELQAHRDWMDDAQERKEDVREALAANDLKKLVTAAQFIDQLTAREQEFWKRTEVKPAQEIAAKNREESRELLKEATAGRLEPSKMVFDRLEKTCASCHDQHFEKLL